MGIARKILLLSIVAIFGLTLTVYSKDFTQKLNEFRTNFLDTKVRNVGYDLSGTAGDDPSYGENYYRGGWKSKEGTKAIIGRAVFSVGHKAADVADRVRHVEVGKEAGRLVERTASNVNTIGNNIQFGVNTRVNNAKGLSSDYAKSRKASARRNGENAAILWEATSSFNPAVHDALYSHWDNEKKEMTPLTLHNRLDNAFNSVRNQGKKKQSGNWLSNTWHRMFPKKQNKEEVYTKPTEVPTNLGVNSSGLYGVEVRDSEETSVSTVNYTADIQGDISNFSNETIIKNLKENRGISFVKNQTLGNLMIYTEVASKDDPNNGQVLCVVDEDRGFSVEYKDSKPFIVSFDDESESVFLSIDEDLDKKFLKVRDSNGIIYDYSEKNVEGSKVITIENPLPVVFSKYLDKNGGHFKKEGRDAYYHVDKHGENKKLVFKKEESSRGLFFVTYDLDSSDGILKPKSAISANGKETITFSEVDKGTIVDSDGVEWRTYPFHYYSGEKNERVDYISLSERPVN